MRSNDEEEIKEVESCKSSLDIGDNNMDCKINLPAGDYTIKTEVYNVPIATNSVTIKEGEQEKINIITGETGKLELFGTKDGNRVKADFYITYKGNRVDSCLGSIYTDNVKCIFKQLPANTYQVKAEYRYEVDGDTLKSEKDFEVTVKPNEFTSLEVEFEIK